MSVIQLTHFDISDLPIWYIGASSRAIICTVAMHRILPSQGFITSARLEYYNCRQRMVNDENELPFGILFAGSPTIHLVDGHHRWYSCLIRGRKRFRLMVDEYKYTYAQAIIDAHQKSQPQKKSQPRHLPALTQMQLALHYSSF